MWRHPGAFERNSPSAKSPPIELSASAFEQHRLLPRQSWKLRIVCSLERFYLTVMPQQDNRVGDVPLWVHRINRVWCETAASGLVEAALASLMSRNIGTCAALAENEDRGTAMKIMRTFAVSIRL